MHTSLHLCLVAGKVVKAKARCKRFTLNGYLSGAACEKCWEAPAERGEGRGKNAQRGGAPSQVPFTFGVEIFEAGHRTTPHSHPSAHELFFILAGALQSPPTHPGTRCKMW